MKKLKIIFAFYFLPLSAVTQNYTAVNGSSYIGSLNVHNNPAAIVNSPLKWDITLFGVQDKQTTNAIEVLNYSLLSDPKKSQYKITPGHSSRYGIANSNLNLLNTRIALNKKSAIAFGVTIKSNAFLKTSPYNFIDTISQFADFFTLNEGAQNMKLDMATGGWAELFATYSQTVIDNEYGRLNAGISLKINKGLSGSFASLANGNFIRFATNPAGYRVTSADFDFGYSSNYDNWDSAKNFKENSRNFFSNTEAAGSFDIGLEWLVKLQSVASYFADDAYFDYDWKIGVSVLDIGYSQYRFGSNSTRARDINPDVTDFLLDNTFDSTINSVATFRDSLARVFSNMGTYTGNFRVTHPARLVFNIDKFITEAFFVNADISINVSSLSSGPNEQLKDLNLLTLTPRWETRKSGFWLPFYYNTRNQFWIGGAVRFGPVLFGVHNWSNIFSNKKMHRGGGYLAIILKAADFSTDKTDSRLNCPR